MFFQPSVSQFYVQWQVYCDTCSARLLSLASSSQVHNYNPYKIHLILFLAFLCHLKKRLSYWIRYTNICKISAKAKFDTSIVIVLPYLIVYEVVSMLLEKKHVELQLLILNKLCTYQALELAHTRIHVKN